MKLTPSQWRWFIGAALCVVLSATVAVLIDLLLIQWRPSFNLKSLHREANLSERTITTLADTAGTISIACILPSNSPAAAPAGRLLRRFEKASNENSGASLEISYIDPRTNPRLAGQMVAYGAPSVGILLRQAGRHVFIPEYALLDANKAFEPASAEEAIAAGFARLSRTDGIQIGWLTGHGEPAFEDTDPTTGFSGFRRALENEGCLLRNITLPTEGHGASIPAEVSVIILTAPRYSLSAAERTQLSDWLDHGGRLLCILPAGTTSGLEPLFEAWGLRIGATPRTGMATTASGASIASLLNEIHPITSELAGKTHITLNSPRALYAFDVRSIVATHLLQLPVAPLPNTPSASQEIATVLLAAERGSLVGADLGFRPGRIVIAGDETFINNSYVLNHASANRDLAINTMRWLTGLSGSGARGASQVLYVGYNRRAWLRLFLISGVLFPLIFCLIFKFLPGRIL
jgi:hypothetical protein